MIVMTLLFTLPAKVLLIEHIHFFVFSRGDFVNCWNRVMEWYYGMDSQKQEDNDKSQVQNGW